MKVEDILGRHQLTESETNSFSSLIEEKELIKSKIDFLNTKLESINLKERLLIEMIKNRIFCIDNLKLNASLNLSKKEVNFEVEGE